MKLRLRNHIVLVLIAGSMLALIYGCENSFDPRGPYQKRIVVYSILSNRSDSQYVRVYSTYNPTGFDPSEITADTYVRNATVKLTDDSTTYQLRALTIPRDDKSRYSDDIGGYVAYPCRTRFEKSYQLSVVTSEGSVKAAVTVPGKGYLLPSNPYVLKTPDKYKSEDIILTIRISSVTKGYLVRLYVHYEVWTGSEWIPKRDEVPVSAVTIGPDDVRFEYPRLTRRQTSIFQSYVSIHFPIDVYNVLYKRLVARYGTNSFQVTGATYILTQVEDNLYKYFNLVNGFQDEFSIRTDLPDFSNIEGGLGIFGAMTEDSVRVDL